MKNFLINENDSGQRIDKFITKALPDLPKSMMYKLIRKKDIKLNGKRCEISTRLETGDTVTVYIKDELSSAKHRNMEFMEASDSIDIIYEDSSIISVFKPLGVDSHPGSGSTDTMIDRIKKYLYVKGDYTPLSENSFAPALCSRLDRNTCGIITAAKNSAALREINSAIRSGQIIKTYLCVTAAPLPKDRDIITAYLKKDENRNTVKISDTRIDGYKPIKTGYKVIASKKGLTLAEVTLFTGRTHQIRAHLAHIGAPLLGDGKYGDISVNKRYGVFMQQLCAFSLRFQLPEESPLHYLNDTEMRSPEPEFAEFFR